jgi:hypothetical protein
MKELMTASAIVTNRHIAFRRVFRNTSQTADKLTVSRDNNFERTPTSIEADMNS